MRPGNNTIEGYKAAKGGDGLRVREDLPRFIQQGHESLTQADKDLLKWVGVFFRKPTPGQFMMRIRMPNGFATSEQLRALAELSRRLGNSVLDITTRQQIELRGFTIDSVPEIWERLRGVNLHSLQTGMDNVRNINGCPLAGLTPHELLDASPIVLELDRIIVGPDGNPEFTNLPRKFNVTVSGCLENCTHNESQDIALVPAKSGERVGFNVLVGGKMGSGGFTVASPLDVFVEPRDAVSVTLELIKIYRDHGPREARAKCRLAFLIEEWGISRLRAELVARLERELEPAGRDARGCHHSDHLGVAPQQQRGLSAVGLCIRTGRISPEQMTELGRLADTYGDGHVRLTTGQNAIIPNVPAHSLDALLHEPLLREFSPTPSPFSRGLVACTGTDFCNLALIETKRRALELSTALEQRLGRGLEPLTIHWSGCPAGCGNHQAADIGLRGLRANIDGQVVDAVAIYVGGRTGPRAVAGEQILEAVPCDEALPDVVATIIRNLELFKQMERDPAAKDRVLMAPTAPLDSAAAESADGNRRSPSGRRRMPMLANGGNGHAVLAGATSGAVGETAKVKACTVWDLNPGSARVVTVQGKALALFALDGRVVATDAECPHEGAPLHEGTIEAGCVVCPLHRYGFDLASGRCDSDADLILKTYPTCVERGTVFVDLGV